MNRKEGEDVPLKMNDYIKNKQIKCKKCGRIYFLSINAKTWRCQNKECQKIYTEPKQCIIL